MSRWPPDTDIIFSHLLFTCIALLLSRFYLLPSPYPPSPSPLPPPLSRPVSHCSTARGEMLQLNKTSQEQGEGCEKPWPAVINQWDDLGANCAAAKRKLKNWFWIEQIFICLFFHAADKKTTSTPVTLESSHSVACDIQHRFTYLWLTLTSYSPDLPVVWAPGRWWGMEEHWQSYWS